ncbi:MAG: RNA polymerase sigma factor [Armatimonadota bacterium]
MASGGLGDELRFVRAAQAGDRAAFDALAARYRDAVRAVAFDATGQGAVAEELAQDALVAAWVHIGDLRDPAAFAHWLRQIALNCCRMWLRRPEPRLDDLAAAEHLPAPASPHQDVWHRLLERELHRALLSVPPNNRAALLMSAFGEMTDGEIAAFLGVPVTTVEGRVYRARRKLRARLQRFLDTLE